MEILLAIIVFGLLGAITIYGYSQSMKASRTAGRGVGGKSDNAAMVSGGGSREDGPSSPNLNLRT